MPKQLQVISGPDKGRTFPLADDAGFLLGRSRQTQSQLTDRKISRVHCQVEFDGAQMMLSDLDSHGGTFVNGKRVTEHVLQPGDIIQIGETQICYMDQSDDLADHSTLVTEAPIAVKPEKLPPERLHELSGKVLSHYDIGPVIGKSATGVVFQARDFKDDRTVALKVLFPEFTKQDEQKRQFIRAMKTLMPLRHPNLVAIGNAGKTGSYCWIAMEYVEGESLTQVIGRGGAAGTPSPLPSPPAAGEGKGEGDWRFALRVAVHTGRALAFAHEHQLIHRNLRPSKILIQQSDQTAKLADLMLAKALEDTLAEKMSRPGDYAEDLHYLSPEQARGNEAVDERSDLFSLGSIVYALLTGRPPFQGESPTETLKKIRKAEPAKPKRYQPSIPELFQGVVLKLLAKRPEERYQSAHKLLADLDRVVQLEPGLPADLRGEIQPGAVPLVRTDTVVEPRGPAGPGKTLAEQSAGSGPVGRTDTVVELRRPRPQAAQQGEAFPDGAPGRRGHWVWLIVAALFAFAAGVALTWLLIAKIK
jgi:eukaryotic-like serine/threonine-protein kinase